MAQHHGLIKLWTIWTVPIGSMTATDTVNFRKFLKLTKLSRLGGVYFLQDETVVLK